MALVVDSSVFISLERRGLSSADIRLIVPDESLTIASVTAAELLTGVHRAAGSGRRETRASFVESVLGLVRVVPFDLAVARTLARIWADLAAAGTPIGQYDMLVAATALTHGYDVLTDNVREFRRVAGLTVIQPTWPD